MMIEFSNFETVYQTFKNDKKQLLEEMNCPYLITLGSPFNALAFDFVNVAF